MSKTVIAFGELLWDIFPDTEALGGAPANFAFRINAFGYSGHLVTRLGNDERGRRAADYLKQVGMPLDYIQWDDSHPTGTVPVKLDANGVPDFTILPNVAYDFIEPTIELLNLARAADCICFGTLIQRAPQSRATLHALLDAAPRALKVLDLNLRKDCYTRETIQASLARAHILKLNETEAQLLAEMFGLPKDAKTFAPAAVKKWNLNTCIVTLGENGVVAANDRGEFDHRPALPATIVDTVGAGDAFTAAFVYWHLEGRPLAWCCAYANALAAIVVGTRGGMFPIDEKGLRAIASLLQKSGLA